MKMQKIEITAALAHRILSYLAGRPYIEVAALVNDLEHEGNKSLENQKTGQSEEAE